MPDDEIRAMFDRVEQMTTFPAAPDIGPFYETAEETLQRMHDLQLPEATRPGDYLVLLISATGEPTRAFLLPDRWDRGFIDACRRRVRRDAQHKRDIARKLRIRDRRARRSRRG